MCMIPRHAKFHMFGSSVSLDTTIKPKPKENVRRLVILLFEGLQTNTQTKVAYFPKIYYCTQF
jgi:hypothetical protein